MSVDLQSYVNAAVAIIVSVTGAIIAFSKARVFGRKHDSTSKVIQKPYEEVLKDSPIFHYVEKDMQIAQMDIRDLIKTVQALELKVNTLEGEVKTLRALHDREH